MINLFLKIPIKLQVCFMSKINQRKQAIKRHKSNTSVYPMFMVNGHFVIYRCYVASGSMCPFQCHLHGTKNRMRKSSDPYN